MITNALLYLLYLLIYAISSPLRLLPNVALPAAITSSISTANTYIAAIYAILPYTIAALLIVLGLVISIEGFIISFKIINWLIRKIPGIN